MQNSGDVFNGADIELQDLIVREIRIASGSKVDIPTGNKVAEHIGAIVNKPERNASTVLFIKVSEF
jgi:hypothetical protein